MKQFIYGLVVVGLFACDQKKDKQTVEVEGRVKNADAKMVYLEENTPNAGPTIMDSATLKKDGSFELKAPAKEEVLYQLRLDGKRTPFAFFINDVSKVKVNADLANSTQPYNVEGSPASQSIINFDKLTNEKGMQIFGLSMRVDSLRKLNASDSLINIEYGKLESAVTALKIAAQETIQNSKSPVLTLYTLGSFQNTANNLGLPGFSHDEIVGIINNAATKFPTHTSLQAVKKNFEAAAQKQGTAIRKAPEFSQPDVNGKPVSLSSFKGKYVLLDFWASWCKPCRMENPNVVKAYNEFKDKNFTVFGVSLDQEKAAWQEAIQKDGLTWTHASDLKFWNNEAATLYQVQSIPANFLIDPDGNIIAQDLRGEDLTQTLRKHLK